MKPLTSSASILKLVAIPLKMVAIPVMFRLVPFSCSKLSSPPTDRSLPTARSPANVPKPMKVEIPLTSRPSP